MIFDISQIAGSVDSLAMAMNCCSKPWPEELAERGFKREAGRFPGTSTWFHNGRVGSYDVRITFYQTWKREWRIRVDLSLPKLLFGDNILLPTHDELREGIEVVSANVVQSSGQPFDAASAPVHRVDYAINIPCGRDNVGALIVYYARQDVPYLLRQTVSNETVYFGNKSRGIRLYDKLAEISAKHPDKPHLIEKASGIVRAEYYFAKRTSVNRFVAQRGLPDSTVNTIISPECIELATSELIDLLNFENIDLRAGDDFRLILDKTGGDLKRAIVLSGYRDAINALGKDCYRNPSYNFSKSTDDRYRRECKSFGISL